MASKLLRVKDVAAIANCSAKTIYRAVTEGHLRPVHVVRLRFDRQEVNRWLASRDAVSVPLRTQTLRRRYL